MKSLIERLMTTFPDAIRDAEVDAARNEVSVRVAAPRIVEIARWLHDTPEAAFDHITDICSVDYPDHPERFEVVYQLLSLPHRRRIRLKARVTEDAPAIASITGIWKGAEFMEREVYDLMGITFTGHPDLRRILLPEDYEEGHPLRKDFPTEGRGWRSTFPFIPRLDEPPAEHAEEGEISDKDKQAFLAPTTGETVGGKNCC